MASKSILQIQSAIASSGIPVRTSGPVIVKRPISGTSKPSQHSFGNAMDYYPSGKSEADRASKNQKVDSLESLYQWLLQKKQSGELPIATLCYYDRGGCTTNHRNHLHVDGKPHLSSVANDGAASPSTSTGEVTAKGTEYLSMTPAQLQALDCGRFGGDYWDHIHPFRSRYTSSQLDALKARARDCGANNPLIPDALEAPLEAVGGSVASVGEFLALLSTGELWVRVAFIIGGGLVGAAGIYFIAREFGAPSVASVASAASGGVAGAAAKAVKGA